MRSTLLPKLLIAGLFFAARPADAADAQPVLVLTYPRDNASKRAAQYLSYGFRDAVARSNKFVVAAMGPLYGEEAVDTRKLARDAEALARAGQADYDNLEMEKATQKFDQALQIYERHLAVFDSVKPAGRIALLAAGTALVSSNEKLGRSLIQKALLFDGNVTPDPRVYNSTMMAVFRDVRNKLSRVAKGSVSIATNPPYSEIYIDGEFAGLAPDRIDRIDGGPHLVRVLREGYRPIVQVVDVKPRGDNNVMLNLTPQLDQTRVEGMLQKGAGELGDKSSGALQAVAQKAKAPLVLLCAVSVNAEQIKTETAVFAADGRRLGYSERIFSSSSDSYREEADRVWQALSAQASGHIDPSTTVGIIERAPQRVSPKPYVTWGLVGVGGAAAIAGGVFGVLALKQSQYFKDNFKQLDPQVPIQQAQIRGKALACDILIGVGVAAAGTGVLLMFLWPEGPLRRAATQGPVHFDFAATGGGALLSARGTF